MQAIAMAGYRVPGRPAPLPGEAPVADYRNVSEDYFRTMGMRLVAGRDFTRHDAEQKDPTVMVINEALARKLWPQQQAIGQTLHSVTDDAPNAWQCVVIAVVSDTRQLGLDEPSRPEMFFPSRDQFPAISLVASTAGDPMRMAPSI